ncbi:hypothetical protein SAMN05443661_11751 [Natronobacterium gregoryi]|uniref:Uncharacterized protein n=3 Tax=Natronobacterium gregoryi TaxID=44930 RepID=L0ADM7_NATGS|nr:hypothetical protein Natgr_0771 [Natronobacterium gregoryi SP2]ELY62711.1 hypothetical protein C490_17402 [Natronobacterium gregoryi SP2]PLK20865.1 hypothetical protein CYV19_07235 [Natronobacterium gregoryi SP2]SFJ19993.1 hypothetical protein SAMN05443661_11751 [Natronobacterium gregoryi]
MDCEIRVLDGDTERHSETFELEPPESETGMTRESLDCQWPDAGQFRITATEGGKEETTDLTDDDHERYVVSVTKDFMSAGLSIWAQPYAEIEDVDDEIEICGFVDDD